MSVTKYSNRFGCLVKVKNGAISLNNTAVIGVV